MKQKVYNKLVRDKIPDVIKSNGSMPIVRTLGDKEFTEELNRKLMEEVEEFLSSYEVEELVDIYEVLLAILRIRNVSFSEFESIRYSKVQKNGAFEKKVFLVSVEEQL